MPSIATPTVLDAASSAIFEHANDGMLLVDERQVYVAANRRACEIFGRPTSALIGSSVESHLADPNLLAAAWQDLVRDGEVNGETAIHLPDGSRRMIEYSVRANVLGEHHLAIVRDVTDRSGLLARVLESEAELRTVLEAAPVGIAIVAPDFTFRTVNPALCDMLGYQAGELTGRSFVDITHPDDVELDVPLARQVFAGEIPSYRIDKRYIHRAGHEIWVQLTASVVHEADGSIRHGIAVVENIDERKRLETSLRRDALTDSLTGLANRVLFRDRVEHALARRPDGTSVAVIYLDLDGFKQLNDTLGHGAGDRLLREVGSRVQSCLRVEDTAARLGGDEFGILIERVVDPRIPAVVAGRVQHAIGEPMDTGGHALRPRVSLGLAVGEVGKTTADELIAQADRTMYEQKARRRLMSTVRGA